MKYLDLPHRHEAKHILSLMDYHALRARLRAVCLPDPHAGPNGRYHVRSLYFDDSQDTALREKLDGLPKREKFRLRIYDRSDATILLEKKAKEGSLCVKRSAALSRAQCERILKGDLDWMAEEGDPLLIDFFAKAKGKQLKPRMLVDYWREAYVYPHGDVRLTFDSEVKSGLYATKLFDPDCPMAPVSDAGQVLLEVKYGAFLPDLIRGAIQCDNRKTTEFSKYARSRIYG